MNELPKISDAEWKVMKLLWNTAPLTSSQIIEALQKTNSWSPKTIYTLISRLVKKGAINAVKNLSCYEYTPLISENKIQTYETKSFISKIYDGSLKLLLSNFVKEEKLTSKEIEELKRILDEK